MMRRPPRSPLFPSTPLFRSLFVVRCFPGVQRKSGAAMGTRTPLPQIDMTAVKLSCARHKLSPRSEEHTSELQSRLHLVCRLLLEKKKTTDIRTRTLHHASAA